ncbi:1-aminocyclopropane-1-carboxylate deaminase [Mucilaginibacter gracilis]|uniref:1-aminocyclopropane-1-carboxylate deaminase n=1 Tax=Mucilaginibacter gracilis TaxID=423350 RepID=A0A495J1K8_9SPHI|nr:pyridoxal-phosphate dependent enzyme [Mucilaginibacter gracilis]RKR82602.1 1-aminocyclopropane-1-carboxylate deaminase [Mucilaginibacter gracilis]
MINLQIYSPVQQIHNRVFTEQGLNVFIKRDDLIHPLISGNKWRKLKYPLNKARSLQKNHLVTFGGAYSNHLLATAAAAAAFGFQATGFVRGEEVSNTHLFLCRLHGMQLIFTDRESYRDKRGLFNNYFGNNADAFFIDEGGASPEAALGCSELLAELPQTYNHIFCACGTGTTAAGIINGISASGMATQFHAVPVFKNGGFMEAEIDKYLLAPIPYHLHTQHHFGGYAKTTPQLIAFIKQFVAATGIMIEPVYTGKMLHCIFDLASAGYFKPGESILAIHTGGVLGLLGMTDKF